MLIRVLAGLVAVLLAAPLAPLASAAPEEQCRVSLTTVHLSVSCSGDVDHSAYKQLCPPNARCVSEPILRCTVQTSAIPLACALLA